MHSKAYVLAFAFLDWPSDPLCRSTDQEDLTKLLRLMAFAEDQVMLRANLVCVPLQRSRSSMYTTINRHCAQRVHALE